MAAEAVAGTRARSTPVTAAESREKRCILIIEHDLPVTVAQRGRRAQRREPMDWGFSCDRQTRRGPFDREPSPVALVHSRPERPWLRSGLGREDPSLLQLADVHRLRSLRTGLLLI